jgi:hypothetical protein
MCVIAIIAPAIVILTSFNTCISSCTDVMKNACICIRFKLQGPNGEDGLGKGLCLVEIGISMDLALSI